MWLRLAWSEEPADEDPDDRSDDRTEQCNRRDTGAPVPPVLPERDHPLEEEKRSTRAAITAETTPDITPMRTPLTRTILTGFALANGVSSP